MGPPRFHCATAIHSPPTRFELVTSRLTAVRSNQLSYGGMPQMAPLLFMTGCVAVHMPYSTAVDVPLMCYT
jgi:hypothetical protein